MCETANEVDNRVIRSEAVREQGAYGLPLRVTVGLKQRSHQSDMRVL